MPPKAILSTFLNGWNNIFTPLFLQFTFYFELNLLSAVWYVPYCLHGKKKQIKLIERMNKRKIEQSGTKRNKSITKLKMCYSNYDGKC